jgi:uncharacterized coiled-coil protein SlyX
MVGELQVRVQELSSLITANVSLGALCEDEKRQRLALSDQVTSLQHQLTERDQTVADMQVRLQSAHDELHALQERALCHEAAVQAERESAEQELAGLSSVVANLQQQLAATCAATAETPPPPPAPTSPSDSAAGVEVAGACDTVIAQFAHVPALRDAIRQRDELQAQLEAAETGDDFVLVGTLGEQLDALMLKVSGQPLSEEDYLTLYDRHAALLQKVTDTCRELAKSRAYAEVKMLGAKLQELKALDVSALPRSWANDPVQPPAPPATAEGEDDGANDPVYVPPHTDEITLA